MNKLLAHWYKKNKDKHGKQFQDQQNFSKLFLSVDGTLGKEDLAVLANFSQLLVEDSRNPFHAYVVRSTAGSQSRSRVITPA